jgi:hypothetical protein
LCLPTQHEHFKFIHLQSSISSSCPTSFPRKDTLRSHYDIHDITMRTNNTVYFQIVHKPACTNTHEQSTKTLKYQFKCLILHSEMWMRGEVEVRKDKPQFESSWWWGCGNNRYRAKSICFRFSVGISNLLCSDVFI